MTPSDRRWTLRRVFRLPESAMRTGGEIDREIDFHIRGRAEELIAGGMSPGDAWNEARRLFGEPGVVRDTLIAVNAAGRRRRRWREAVVDVLHDFRVSVRSLRRRPAFSVTSLVVLTIGIGAAVAMYAIIDGVLLQRLPYREPEQLVSIYTTFPYWKERPVVGVRWNALRTPYPEYQSLAADSTAFRAVAAFGVSDGSLTIRDQTIRVIEGTGSANLLDVLGVRVATGRWFLPGEEGVGAPRIAVLSHELWRRSFGGHPLVGATITLGESPFTVVGILAPGFALEGDAIQSDGLTQRADLWTPLGVYPSSLQPGNHTLELIGRLRDGVSVDGAQSVAERLLRGDRPPDRRGGRVAPRAETETAGVRKPLWLLFGAVGVLLLITCVNVASLFIGECASREGELRTRAILGAGRGRLVRLLAIESATLSATSAAAGLIVGWLMIRFMLRAAPVDLPHAEMIGLNARVAAFSIAAAALAALIAGMAPAFTFTRADVVTKSAGARVAAGRSRLQQAALALQSGLSIVLIAGAVLLARSLANAQNVDAGFNPAGLIAVEAQLPNAFEEAAGGRGEAYELLRQRISGIAGVRRVAAVYMPPLIGRTNGQTIRPDIAEQATAEVERMVVSPNYFDVMRIRLLAGRGFTAHDTVAGEQVAIVSDGFARRFWPNASALGRRFRHPNGVATIVGVVGDVVNRSFERRPEALFYLPLSQRGAMMSFIIDVGDRGAGAAPAIQRGIWDAVPHATVARIVSMEALVDAAGAPQRYRALLAASFAAIALLLTTVGVAGLAARSVSARMTEWCVRLALGAPMRDVFALAIRDGSFAVLGGTVVGLAASQFTSRWISDYLFGVDAADLASHMMTATITAAACATALVLATGRLRRSNLAGVLRGEA